VAGRRLLKLEEREAPANDLCAKNDKSHTGIRAETHIGSYENIRTTPSSVDECGKREKARNRGNKAPGTYLRVRTGKKTRK